MGSPLSHLGWRYCNHYYHGYYHFAPLHFRICVHKPFWIFGFFICLPVPLLLYVCVAIPFHFLIIIAEASNLPKTKLPSQAKVSRLKKIISQVMVLSLMFVSELFFHHNFYCSNPYGLQHPGLNEVSSILLIKPNRCVLKAFHFVWFSQITLVCQIFKETNRNMNFALSWSAIRHTHEM